MSRLGDIAVTVENDAADTQATGNVMPILYEVLHALERLLKDGDPATIDLRAIPLAPGEEEELEEALGKGEVEVVIDALGESRVVECMYPGVWLVTHRNSHGEIMTRMIEIAVVPAILKAQRADMEAAAVKLRQRLSGEDAEGGEA